MTQQDKKKIMILAQKYKAKRVFLFGSMLDNPETARDIDLGIEGAKGVAFFSMGYDLMLALSKPVDIVDMDVSSPFSDMIQREGVLIYG